MPPESAPAARSIFGGLSCQLLHDGRDRRAFRALAQHAEAGKGRKVEHGHRGVLADGTRQREPFRDPVGGKISDTVLQAAARGREFVRSAVDAHDAAGDRLESIDRADQFRFAAADEARDTGDLARPGVEVHVAEAAVGQREVLDIDQDLARLVRDRRKQQVDLAAGHQFDQFAVGRCGGIERPDVASVAQYGDAIRERADLAQAMRDIDEADILALQLGDQLEQPAGLALGQRGGRLVENEQAHPAKQRLGDLGHLLVRAREVIDALRRIEVEAEFADECLRAAFASRGRAAHLCLRFRGRGTGFPPP